MPEKMKKPIQAPSASGKLTPLKTGPATHTQEKKVAGPLTPQQEYATALKRTALEVGKLRKNATLAPAQLTALQEIAAQVKQAAGEAQKAKPDAHRLAEMLTRAQAQMRGLKAGVPHAEVLETRLAKLLEQTPKLF